MQSLSMMVPAHIFNCDANVPLQRWRCKNLVMQMSPNGYVMIQMSPCHDANAPLMHAMMRMSAWEYAYDANAPL